MKFRVGWTWPWGPPFIVRTLDFDLLPFFILTRPAMHFIDHFGDCSHP